MGEERFDAFVSYSHQDALMASEVERAVERFAKPWYRRPRVVDRDLHLGEVRAPVVGPSVDGTLILRRPP